MSGLRGLREARLRTQARSLATCSASLRIGELNFYPKHIPPRRAPRAQFARVCPRTRRRVALRKRARFPGGVPGNRSNRFRRAGESRLRIARLPCATTSGMPRRPLHPMRRFKPSGESVNPYQRRPDARLLIAHGVADGGLGARDRGQLAQRAPGDGAEIDMTVQGIGITCAAASARGRRPDTNRPRIIRVSSASNRNPESNLACLWSSVSGSAGCGAGGAVPGWRAPGAKAASAAGRAWSSIAIASCGSMKIH